MLSKFNIVLLLVFLFFKVDAASILLNTNSAVVWLPAQTISGRITTLSVNKLRWHLNNTSGVVTVQKNGTFNFSILLAQTNNLIWVESIDHKSVSDSIQYTLGYKALPEVKPLAVINNSEATLSTSVINNPYNLPLKFTWKFVKGPAPVALINTVNDKAIVKIPDTRGDYFFMVTVYAGNDSASYKTYVTRSEKGLHAFNFSNEYSAWIDSAIIYEITPYTFVKYGHYTDITQKLPEIKQLGINTIWLQPVYKTHDGEQGYDITDYFALRDDLGTAKQLHELVSTAKKLNMRVLFDFVPNHTSTYYSYAQEVKQIKNKSHYYNFYQHTDDGAKYSSQYQIDSNGFVHYFWPDLININYDNDEVQRWMIEAYKYWLQEYDLDGFRIDAAWAYNARNPSFGKQLQTILKSIKPDILLLVEDKGALSSVYKEGYDAAYDWTADSGWISSWSWSTDYAPKQNPTVFNYENENRRSALFNKSLFNNGDTTHLRLRFLENNDVQRFITANGLERTKMAAALLFSIPGIPLIYDGQEIGFQRRINGNKAVFKSDESIQSLDTSNLFVWYEQLTHLRTQHDALRSIHMQSLPVNKQTLYALHRWSDNENFIVLTNFGSENSNAEVNIQSLDFSVNSSIKYTDVLTGEIFYADSNNSLLHTSIKSYTTRLLLQLPADVVAADK